MGQPLGEGQFQHRASVLDGLAFPEITGVCEEAHGGSKRLVEAPQRPAAGGDALRRLRLFGFKLPQPGLVGLDQCRAVGFDDPIDQLLDGGVELPELCFQMLRLLPGFRQPPVPQVRKHGMGEIEQLGRWLERGEKLRELRFDLIALDRLAVMVAAALLTEVVRIEGQRETEGPCGGTMPIASPEQQSTGTEQARVGDQQR